MRGQIKRCEATAIEHEDAWSFAAIELHQNLT